MTFQFNTIALAKEIESPENPGALEKRVALVPADVGILINSGLSVSVEQGAGEGIGYCDQEYASQGATLENANQIYRDKDLIIKFKGPSLNSIPLMKPGCTLLCMAHFHSYPDRAKMLHQQRVNVLAMEEILESPKSQTDTQILGRLGMAEALFTFIEAHDAKKLDIRVIGYSDRLLGAIQRAGNRNPKSLQVLQNHTTIEELNVTGPNTLYFYDSSEFEDPHHILEHLKKSGSTLFDLAKYEKEKSKQATAEYRRLHNPFKFGLRRIQCLHETGQAGARYGVKLLLENHHHLKLSHAKVLILGYGNVAKGALHELYNQGVNHINILGRNHTHKSQINEWLESADLIINGAEQAEELRGKNYLISNEHLKNNIPNGSIVIDLVGGSETNRSPVEAVLSCTFLTDPHFIQDGVTVSALWGWPMLGMMKESAMRYSGQIVDVLLGKERLIEGIKQDEPGVQRALVCGPF